MALTSGTKLGPYEIESPLGAGGMGEVYRARDTRLDRTVAVKILPAHLSANAEAKQRFEREARAISSLSHPNICQLYDVGAQDGLDYLVMEFLEGETLAERLARGPLPLEQLLRCGMEIAEGLERAHRSGVVHRDLKPGNIMLTKAGAKLMDFGLAKSAVVSTASQPASELTQGLTGVLSSPRPTQPLTVQGTVVGTFQYMSPEQVEGKEADGRSDIFALGALLFEMVTGKRAFEGKSAVSAMAAVLERDPPPISSLAPASPAALDRIVKTCLEKDPGRRFQSAHDVGLQLQWLGQSSQTALAAVAASRTGRGRRAIAVAALALGGVILGVATGMWLRPAARNGAQVLATVPAPANVRFEFTGNFAGPAVVSADGRNIAFSGSDEAGVRSLWIRNLASGAGQSLPGTTNATFPFWSPDGAALGFFTDGKLKTIRLAGNEITVVADAPVGRGGAWAADGTIVFEPSFQTGLLRVPAGGGAVQPVTTLTANGPTTHRWPCFLPDGRHFLYLAANHATPRGEENGIYAASLDGGAPRLIVHTTSNPVYAAGYLLYLKDDNLLAQKLDLGKLELTGQPIILARNVTFDLSTWRGVYSGSENGVFVYQAGNTVGDTLLTWYDRSGKTLGTVGERGLHQAFRISPDGKRVVVAEGYPKTSLWIYELGRDVRTRLTSTVDDEDINPVWSPDGKWIAFARLHGVGSFNLYRKRSDGSGAEELLLNSRFDVLPVSWSPDGRHILYMEGVRGAGMISALPVEGDRKPLPVINTGVDKYKAQFSPDGRWIVYQSVETMRPEINVTSFPGHAGNWQVSTGGGNDARWNRNGKELFYFTFDDRMMSVDVNLTGSSFQMGASRALFPAHPYASFYFAAFDVSPDGQRFLLNTTLQSKSAPLTVLVNWAPK